LNKKQPYSTLVPDSLRRTIVLAAKKNKMTINGLCNLVLGQVQGRIASVVTENFPQCRSFYQTKWERISLSISKEIYDEIVEVSRLTGIRRQRVVGVILIANGNYLWENSGQDKS